MAVTRLSDLVKEDVEDQSLTLKGSFRVRPSGYRYPIGLNQTINTTDTFNVFTTATGGTQTTSGTGPTEAAIHTFTSPGSFQMVDAPSYMDVQILAVGGGGGGGGGAGGGGGGGGLVYMNSYRLMNTSYTITVGTGGNGLYGPQSSSPGGYSNVKYTGANVPISGNVSARRGGAGSADGGVDSFNQGGPQTGTIGSQGGGCARFSKQEEFYGPTNGSNQGGTPGSVSPDGFYNFGHSGGKGPGSHPQSTTNSPTPNKFAGGGGGGAGANGTPSLSLSGDAGNGGAGLTYSISGSSITYAGGGGGGKSPSSNNNPNWTGTGGPGGGGNAGATYPSFGSPGTDGLGGGGGGASGSPTAGGPNARPNPQYTNHGGAGGDGVVIIRYNSFQSNADFDIN